jgi:Holliday junction resolvasome RuvABC endonuclease subunit
LTKVLGLDISTKTGFAVIEDGKLLSYGLLKTSNTQSQRLQDLEMYFRAHKANSAIFEKIEEESPDYIFAEQTNAGKFRSSQKQLEFIHCLFLQALAIHSRTNKLYYVDTSRWRSDLSIKLTKDQRKHNKSVKDGVARGKVTPKHLAVLWANNMFNLKLLKKDHDIADAIALAYFGYTKSLESQKKSLDLDQILLELKQS